LRPWPIVRSLILVLESVSDAHEQIRKHEHENSTNLQLGPLIASPSVNKATNEKFVLRANFIAMQLIFIS
jgi:hypothetical protein